MLTRRVLLIAALVAPAALPRKKNKKRGGDSKPVEPLGIVAGTVFTAEGRSLPGANVELADPDGATDPVKVRADARGEFAIRAPGRDRPYVLRAEAEGFAPAVKETYCYVGQRTNVNLLLKPE